MTGERDIVRFAFPFTAGIVAACFIPTLTTPWFSVPAALICIIPATCLMAVRPDQDNQFLLRISIASLAFLTGMICMVTDASIGMYGSTLPSLDRMGLEFCRSIRENLESLPFTSEKTGPLLSALITGDRSSLSKEIIADFRASGASHILALSGLHLGIIYGIIRRLTTPIGNGTRAKMIRSAITLSACSFYTIATGSGESIVRAFLFILIYETAVLTHRNIGIRQVLPAVMIIHLATDPSAIMSISFQLSYAAMAAIAYIYPYLKGFWPENESSRRKGVFQKVWNTAALSISCQIATAPLAWYYFSSMPQHFLISNLIALPLTGIIIPLALLTLVLNGIGICPTMLAAATDAAVSLLIWSLEVIAAM